MLIEMLYSKIHRATVTDANLNYVGSITVDEALLEASKMRVGQKVEILNINNGTLNEDNCVICKEPLNEEISRINEMITKIL